MSKPTTLRTFEITKNKTWLSTPKLVPNTHGKKFGSDMQIYTICAKLPTNASHVVSVVVNGVLAYDLKEDQQPLRTSVIGGGGRYELRRRYWDGECVGVEIMFKDIIFFTKKKPTIKIIAAVFEEEEK